MEWRAQRPMNHRRTTAFRLIAFRMQVFTSNHASPARRALLQQHFHLLAVRADG